MQPNQQLAAIRFIAFVCVTWIGYVVTQLVVGGLNLIGLSIQNRFQILTSNAVSLMAAIWYSSHQRRRAHVRADAA